jgi:hypothetical protein
MAIEIFGIDRDNGDGRYVRRHSFRPFEGPINLTNKRGLVYAQDTDAGLIATIEAPDGSRIEDDRLHLADGTTLSADDALAAANDRSECSFGVRLTSLLPA